MSRVGITAVGVASGEIPPELDPADARQRKTMSRAARLAAVAARRALVDAGWAGERGDVGYFLGVGASGGSIEDLAAVLRASLVEGRVSLARLGAEGLSATNPVATFQLLNNFTLCHSAILEGTGGPNGAFFSRGGGTVAALMEAAHAIEEGTTDRALAGGADTALHEVTRGELLRGGWTSRGLVPGEGAAVLALERIRPGRAPIAVLERCLLLGARRGPGALADAIGRAADLVVISPWGDPPRDEIRSALRDAAVIDATSRFGESLAAAPALAWTLALERLASGEARRALVISAGIDDQIGLVELSA